jgi:hypothetical protein
VYAPRRPADRVVCRWSLGFPDLRYVASRSFPRPTDIPPDPTRFCILRTHEWVIFHSFFYLSIFFFFFSFVLAHTMRNKNRVRTAKPHTRKKNTHTHRGKRPRGEEKMNKSLPTVFDYFSKSIYLLMRCPNGSRLIYCSRPLLIINFIVRLALQHAYYNILVYAQLFILSSSLVYHLVLRSATAAADLL